MDPFTKPFDQIINKQASKQINKYMFDIFEYHIQNKLAMVF